VPDPLSIDGFGPLPVRRPASVGELGELVREAAGSGRAVYPVGTGTALDLGLPPAKPGEAVETTRLSGVVDHAARDLTITVRAGTTATELGRVLAAEGQRLPVDFGGTVGGAIACNRSGPRRLGFGTLRDYLIGISFVADDGTEVKAGGRVVKNVAGYDLMKLHTGALGTLGVVTQATFKVTPVPEASAVVAFGVNAAAVGPTLDRLHASASRPVAVELLNRPTASGLNLPASDPWVIAVGFEEKAATVAWQVSKLLDELKAAPVRDVTQIRGADGDRLWAALAGSDGDSPFVLKATTRPSRTAAVAAELAAAHPDLRVQAHAGNGIVHGSLSAADLTAERASAIVTAVTAAVGDGSVTLRRCPPAWKRQLPVWGRPRADWAVMRAVKRTLDPTDLFNPGRLFG
jgi:glycolate oxidase FAD binding subunit